MIAWSPLAGGLLGGALNAAQTGRRAAPRLQEAITQHHDQLQAYETLCAELAVPPAQVALAWVLANPVVTAPIIGPRTTAQLDSAFAASETILAPATLTQLDAIFPGPGGAAPEAYAR